MKVPISSAIHNSNSLNHNSLNTTFNLPSTTTPSSISSCYEPTSVLDLQSSPTLKRPTTVPPLTAPVFPTVPDVLSAANSPPPAVDLDNVDVWDSILTELGVNDDSSSSNNFSKTLSIAGIVSAPCSANNLQALINPDQLHQPHPFDQAPLFIPPSDHHTSFSHDFDHNSSSSNIQTQLINCDFGAPSCDIHPAPGAGNNLIWFDFIDDLIRAAQSFESNDSHHVQLVLARLNQRLITPLGKPLERAAFYFKEALQSLFLTGSNRPVHPPSSYEIVQIIRAYKVFCGISPIPFFSTFASNQAVLEAIDGSSSSSGSTFVHIVEFDVGFGGHWASLMREIADRATGGGESRSIFLRITAVVPEEFEVENNLVRENLIQFARELNINFQIEYVHIRTFEILSFKSIKFIQGETLVVHLSPAIFNRLGSRNNVSKFVADLRGVSPHVVVVVDREVGIDTGTASFSLNFVAGLEFYTAMMESLDGGGGGGGGDWVRRIEMLLLRPRISAAVEAAGRRMAEPWRKVLLVAGAKATGPSQFAESQAECLLRRLRVDGFHVAKQQGELLLCWHDRPLVATSTWTC